MITRVIARPGTLPLSVYFYSLQVKSAVMLSAFLPTTLGLVTVAGDTAGRGCPLRQGDGGQSRPPLGRWGS